MKKLLVFALLCLTAPVLALAAPQAEVATVTADAPSQQELLTEIFGPEALEMTGCSAEKDCGDGTTAECTGSTSCYVISTGVSCDGQVTECPNLCQASAPCFCGGTVFCSSLVGNCSSGSQQVTCDGQTYECPNFCLG